MSRKILIVALFLAAGIILALGGCAIAAIAQLPPADKIVGASFSSQPGAAGTDHLGRDVLARALSGNAGLLLTAAGSAFAATSIGACTGIALAWFRPLRPLVRIALDVFITLPPVLLVLVAATIGDGSALVIGAVTVILSVPASSRFFESVCSPLLRAGFIEIATAEGRSRLDITVRDLLPELTRPLATEMAVRFTAAVYLISTVAFLGGGTGGGGADWANSLRESIDGLSLNPWAVIVPALCIALLTVPPALLADALRSESKEAD